MNEHRKGEIAYIFLKFELRKKATRITPDMQREFGNMAKISGIPVGEVAEFLEILIREMVDDMFTKPAKQKEQYVERHGFRSRK